MMDSLFVDENLNIYNCKNVAEKLETWLKQNRLNDHENMAWEFTENLWRGIYVGVSFDDLTGLNLRPEWLDLEKIKIAQKFAQDFYLPICTSEVVSLLLSLSHDGVLRKLISTGKSSDPYTSFKRYLSTGRRVRSWLFSDLLDKESEGFKNINRVNAIHRSFYNSVLSTDKNDFLRKTELSVVESSVCPFLAKDLLNIPSVIDSDDVPTTYFPMAQAEMAGTQFSFACLLILHPQNFGICPIKYKKELECFIHLWRYIAYRLGTLDQFNLCVGSYDEVIIKSRIFMDFIIKPNIKRVTPVWEHMTRCIIEGFQFTVTTFSFEAHLLYVLDTIGIHCPNLYSQSSMKTIAEYKVMKFVNYYVMPINWMRSIITKLALDQIDRVASNMPTEEQFYSRGITRRGHNQVNKISPASIREDETVGLRCNIQAKVIADSSTRHGESVGQDLTGKMTSVYSMEIKNRGKEI